MTHQFEHPWQQDPAELISSAIEHIHRPSDMHQRVGFLLLDLGVETLFKIYLLLPTEVTITQMPVADRIKAADGSFPDLLHGMSRAASNHLEPDDLNHVGYYHGVRNKLYHQGVGVTVASDHVRGYAALAVKLLNRLLGVDLSTELPWPHPPKKPKKPGRYAVLRVFFEAANERNDDHLAVSFQQIEDIISASLPPSARKHREWWGNWEGFAQAKAWLEAGWRVERVDLQAEKVSFRRA